MLAEWHLSPEYILEHWTDHQIEAFWQARNRRILETSRALRPADNECPDAVQSPGAERRKVSDTEYFNMAGIGEA